jgi:2-dehydro-3-deoxyphosphogluconate aldolase/(4S)-4-hydroxy-2-oxoglutarate aldolase
MSRAEVCRHVEEVGLVPVVRAPSAELAIRAVEAILAGGVSVCEITLTVPGALDTIRSLCGRLGGRACIGAGTVLAADEATACIDAGAQFIVSPGLDLRTLHTAQEHGVAVMPGALTPTEVITAWQRGADMVKIFPCSAVGGAKYLRALRGPLPQVKFLPTGGVNLTTAADYIAAGASALGIGTDLVDVSVLEAGRDGEITERARGLVQVIRAARAKLR